MKKEEQLPIDRGWAWVIVIAACCLICLQAGEFKCQGILLVELTERYEGIYPTSTLIWVLTVKYTLAAMCGPVVSMLIVKLKHRTVAFIGVCLEAISYIGLAYSFNLTTMFIFHSIPGGVGGAMIILVSYLVSGDYFRKRQALALGLIAGGSGIGTIVTPHVLRALFDNFSFSGAALLHAGFVLQFLIPVCLLTPISYYKDRIRTKPDGVEVHEDYKELIALQSTENNRVPDIFITDTNSIMLLDEVDQKLQIQTSDRERSHSFNHLHNRHPSHAASFSSSSKIEGGGPNKNLVPQKDDTRCMLSIGDVTGSAIFLNREPEERENVPTQPHKERFNWRVVLMPKFLIAGISIFFYAFGMCVIFAGVPALGKESGIPKDTIALAVMMAGMLEIPSRIANGYIADKRIIPATAQYGISLLIAGLVSILCAIISGLTGIAIVLAGMMSVGTSIFSLMAIVIRELIGAENVTSGMGIQLAFQSVAFIASSYIAGAIYDATDSWRIVYFYIGSMMILSSSVTWPYCLRLLCRRWCNTSEKLMTEETATKLDT